MRRVVVAVLLLALLLGAVGAAIVLVRGGEGSGARPEAVQVEPEPGSDEPPRPALRRFYAQELAWEPCRGEFECATLDVPLDYDEPDGDTVELALLKAPALDPASRVGSLVVNPGGPGGSGVEYAAQSKLVFRDPLLDRFDIVGLDPRGTGASDPVDCLTDDELDAYLAFDPAPDTAREEAEAADWVERLGAGCAERSGRLAAHVTTVEAARDLDVVRAALGDNQLDYFGASYGTKLGATYAELFPVRVGRFVLDGAVDLSLDARRLSLEQAEGFETALRAYVENCLESAESCFLGDSVEEGLDRISAFLDEVDASPLPTGTDRELAVGNAFYGIVAPLYNEDYWFVLSAALQQGFDGDGTALLQLADSYSARGPDGYTSNQIEALYAISCLDEPFSVEPARVAAELPEFEAASPTFGEVFAWGLTGCGGVELRADEEPPRVRAAGAAPIVVVGTTRDPATPYDWAVSLAEQLESGVLVSRDGDGHTGYNAGNDCVDEAIEGYLVEGTVPDDGLSC